METDELRRSEEESRTSVLAQVSTEMVRVYKERFGRGPSRVRSFWCGDDVLTVVLENTLTPAERSLARMGEHARVRETRLVFQYASLTDFCAPIERITGRRVKAFVSGIDAIVDGLSIENFVFHPVGDGDAPDRTELQPV
jgi:uncharacterized protein YbcI